MKTKMLIPVSNISDGVEFFLRGAKKRRAMAAASVREVNSGISAGLKLVSSNK